MIEPRRWFWRNSRGARGVIEVWREPKDGDEVLGGRALPAGLPLGVPLDLLAPALAASPFTGVVDMAEDVGGGNTARLSTDIMDVRRQERVATILDNHVEQKYRPLSNPVTLPDTNHFSPSRRLLPLSPFSRSPVPLPYSCHRPLTAIDLHAIPALTPKPRPSYMRRPKRKDVVALPPGVARSPPTSES